MRKPRLRLLPMALAALLALPTAALSAPATGDQEKEEAGSKDDDKAKWDVNDPPGEWRTVAIDTETTTWTSLDVSPDGATIVFDMLGDLYTVPMAGGEATALTSDIAWNFEPRFSPDGKRIAFVSDRGGADNIWIMNADGSGARAVTDEKEDLMHNPFWSPDGDYLLAKKGITSSRSIPAGEIWLFHMGGGEGLPIAERPNGKDDQKTIAEPAFSPDGRYIYYSQDVTPGRVWAYNKDSTGQIFVIKRHDRETGEVTTFVDGAGGAIRPVPSPDGKSLAFVRRTPDMTSALYVKDLVTGVERAVYGLLDRDFQETNGSQGNTPAFAWTPDSRDLVFWAGGRLRRIGADGEGLRPIPVRVTAELKVAPTLRVPVDVAPDDLKVRMLRWLQVSPDGRTAMFQTLGRVWLQDLKSGKRRPMTGQSNHLELHPAFSRDGRQVVYATWDDRDLGSLWTRNLDGSGERKLTSQPGHYVEPAFSPDGKTVVYRKISGGYLLSGAWSTEPGLYAVPAAGGEPVRISEEGFAPHFGTDPERVFFTDGAEDGAMALKSVDLAGHEEREHLQGSHVREFAVSPDGRWIGFVEQYNAWVAPFPRTGRKVTIGKSAKAFPVRQVSARAGEGLHWSGDASTLRWSHGPTLYSRDLADAFAFLEDAPEELPEPATEGRDLSFTVPADRPTGVLALTGGRVVTMRDADQAREVIENGVVVIEGNRIAAVGKAGEVDIPRGAFVLDAAGKTVIPGLVDVHAHGAMARSGITPQQNWMQLSNLSFGVTTIHDPSNDTASIFAAAEMQRAGLLVAPRIFSTGTILYGAKAPGYRADIDSYEDALFHVRRMGEVGAITVKSYQQPRRDQRQQVVAAGRELGVMVVPEGGAKFQHNMNEIVDGHTGIEHALSIARGYDDVKQLWSATGTGYTPTFVVAYGGLSGETYWYDRTEVWKNERLMSFVPRFLVEPAAMRRTTAPDLHYNHFEVARFARELRELGVTVHIGAHGQREGLAAHWELWMMGQGGFTPWEALRGGTIDGARYLGLDGDIGSIEPGKLADLAVIDGNVLNDLRLSEKVAYTVLNGRLYEAATMNQIAPDRVEREELFFKRPGGDTIHPLTRRWLEELRDRHGWDH